MAEIKLEDLMVRNSLAGDVVLTIGLGGQLAMVNIAAVGDVVIIEPVYGPTITISNIEVL